MKIFDKKNVVKIAEDDLNDANLSCADFADTNVRKRSYIDVLGARLAMKHLFSMKINANNLYSMYTIHNVLEEIDVADIYFKDIKIDVRLVFNREEIFVPKSHFDCGILPDIYFVLGLNDDLSEAEFLGYFEPNAINKSNENRDFYFLEPEKLNSPKDLKKFLSKYTPERSFISSQEDEETAKALFLSLIDKEIESADKLFVLQQLANSFSLREKLVEFENFELMSKLVAKDESLLKDSVLDIVGAQAALDVAEEELLTVDLLEEVEELTETKTNWGELKTEEELLEEEFGTLEEQTESEEESKSSGFGEAIVGGAVSGGVIAGGIIAGQAMASAAAIPDLPSINIDGDINLPEFGSSKKEDLFDTELDELAEITEEIPESITEESDNFELDELNEEPQEESQEEIQEEYNFEQYDKIEVEPAEEILDEVGEIFEEAIVEDISAEEVFEEEVSAEENILQEIEVGELEPLGELSPLEEVEELQIDGVVTSNLAEEESKEDVYDLNNFDFDMFDETETTEPEVKSFDEIEIQDVDADENVISMEELEGHGESSEEVVDEDQEEFIENLVPPSTLEDNILEEVEDFDGVSKGDYTDIKELTSQVDEFLKDIELTDEQKGALSGEFLFPSDDDEIKMAVLEENEPYVPAVEYTLPETSQVEQPQFDSGIENFEENDDKEVLKELFKSGEFSPGLTEDDTIDFENMPRVSSTGLDKNKKTLIAASVAGVILVSLVAGGIKLSHKEAPTTFPDNTQDIAQNIPQDASQQAPDSIIDNQAIPDQAAGPEQAFDSRNLSGQDPQMSSPDRDMGQAVSDAFTSEPVTASVTKIAWEVPEDLAYNDSFRKYLQIAGKNLKLNLQSSLLLATEMAYSNKVVIDLEINKDGTLKASNIEVSSGSKQIDQIVLKSVKETLSYLKMPSSELSGQSVSATLIINF